MARALPRTKGKVTSYSSLVDYTATVEGFSRKPYWDIKQWTNGYGTKARHKNEIITRAEAKRRLHAHMLGTFNKLKRICSRAGLNVSYAYALTDFSYNLGMGWYYSNSGLAKAVKSANKSLIKAKMLQYNKARNRHGKLVVLRGLDKRRKDEVSWITDGVLPATTDDTTYTSSGSSSLPPQTSYTGTAPTQFNATVKIEKKVIDKTEISDNVIRYEVIKDFQKHHNIHKMVIQNVTTDYIKILADSETRVEVEIHLRADGDLKEKKISSNKLKVRHIKQLARSKSHTFVSELLLINETIDLFTRVGNTHSFLNGKTVFDGLTEVNKTINANFETDLEIVTNGTSLDAKGSSGFELFKMNENYNDFSYEQLVIQQDVPFNQVSNLVNNHYNVFHTPAFWFFDDSVFSSIVEHDIVLEIYDPTQNKIMNLNVMREATDRPDNEVFNYTSLFDTEKTLHVLSQNFVLNKPNGFQVFNTNSHSTSGVVLNDNIDYFVKRVKRMMEWVKTKPVTYSIEFKDLDVTRVRQMEQYDVGNNAFDTTVLNTHTVFTQRPTEQPSEDEKHKVMWFASQNNQFYMKSKES
jgi:GH24 family phage-related lysozyme (muramidase)